MFKNELITNDKKKIMKENLDDLSIYEGLIKYSNLAILYDYLQYCDVAEWISPEEYVRKTSCKVSSSTLRKWYDKYKNGYRLSDYINISNILYLYLLEYPYPNCDIDVFDKKRYYTRWDARELRDRFKADCDYEISVSTCRNVINSFYMDSKCKSTNTILQRNRRNDIAIISWGFYDKPIRKSLCPTDKKPPVQTEFFLRINATGYVGEQSRILSQGEKVLMKEWINLIMDEIDDFIGDDRIKEVYIGRTSDRSSYVLKQLRLVYANTGKQFELCD